MSTATATLLTKDLMDLGFAEVDPTIYHSFSCSTVAKEKEGKTTWAFTAPGPIAAISTDTGTEDIAKNFLTQKQILLCDFKSAGDMMNSDASAKEKQEMYEAEWARMKKVIIKIIGLKKFRTLIIDTATEMWELCRLAEFGKLTQVMPHHYTTVNNEFKALIKATEQAHINSIWIHKMKKEYKTKADGKDSWTGKYERQGFGDMPFLVDVNLRHYFHLAQNEEDTSRFGINIIDSRVNMLSVVGSNLEGDQCNFEELAIALYPETYGTKTWR